MGELTRYEADWYSFTAAADEVITVVAAPQAEGTVKLQLHEWDGLVPEEVAVPQVSISYWSSDLSELRVRAHGSIEDFPVGARVRLPTAKGDLFAWVVRWLSLTSVLLSRRLPDGTYDVWSRPPLPSTALARGTVPDSAGGSDVAIHSFVISAGGTHYVGVSGTARLDYVLAIARRRLPDRAG